MTGKSLTRLKPKPVSFTLLRPVLHVIHEQRWAYLTKKNESERHRRIKGREALLLISGWRTERQTSGDVFLMHFLINQVYTYSTERTTASS